MKKMLIFSLAYYPHVGGAEVAIKEITDRISDIEFHMVTLRFSRADAAEETVGNMHVHRVGFGPSYISKILFIPCAVYRAISLNEREHFDVLWAVMTYMLFPIVWSKAFNIKKPYVLTLQEGDPFKHVFGRWYIKIFSGFLKFGFRRAAVVQAISTYLAQWARGMGYRGLVEVIPNGVDTQKFAGENVPHQGIMLITTSRLVRKNAVDDIIRALALIPHGVTLRILGTGSDERALKDLAKKLGVSSRVEFLGHVDHAELPNHLHAADIFVRPSRSEGMGNSFIEAMAAGLPVIATQEGGIADFLFDATRNPEVEPTGFAVDKNSPEQIAAAVKYIVGNPDEVKKVVANAQRLALQKYDWDLIATNMRERVFDKLFEV